MKYEEYDSYAVIKIKGTDPEIFWIIWANPKQPKPRGFLFHTSNNLSESELRTELAKMGLNQPRIEGLIEQARANPR